VTTKEMFVTIFAITCITGGVFGCMMTREALVEKKIEAMNQMVIKHQDRD
jgi:hypothetical protein